MAYKAPRYKRFADFLEKLAAGFVLLGFGGGWVSTEITESDAVYLVSFGVIAVILAKWMDIQDAKENIRSEDKT